MSAFSKFFQDHIRTRTCQTFIHTDPCTEHLLKDLILFAISNLKYFAPICILPALIKIRKMNKERLLNTLEYYLKCSLIGGAVGWFTNFQICLYRKLLGEFGFYTFLFIPAFISGYIAYLGTPRIIDLFETSTFQTAIETILIRRRNILSRSIGNSQILQTLVFMLCSAIILHGKQLYNTKGFWLLTPNPQIKSSENMEYQKCELHPTITCKHYLMEGMRKYFILGLSLDTIKTIMSKVKTTKNQSQILAKLRNFRIRSMALLTAYIGIYRFTHCWLNRSNIYPDTLNHLLASFSAGFCYYFYPQSTLFAYALVQTIRTIWKIIQISNADTKNEILKKLLCFPYAKVLYPFALAHMVHFIALRPQYSSRLASAITNGLCNNFPNHIQKVVISLRENLAK